MWASICLLRLTQRLPRNPFFTNNPPILYLFYLHSVNWPMAWSLRIYNTSGKKGEFICRDDPALPNVEVLYLVQKLVDDGTPH